MPVPLLYALMVQLGNGTNGISMNTLLFINDQILDV
jgi:hypothetical protein